MRRHALLVGLLILGAPLPAAAGVAGDVAAVSDGEVRLTYDARPDVWGDGHNLCIGNRGRQWFDGRDDLTNGPVRVTLTKRGDRVVEVEMAVGGRWRRTSDDTVDLGAVDAAEAAAFLLDLARHARHDDLARDALCAAVVAADVTVWPDLLAIARDPDAGRAARNQAVFWLAHEAGEAVLRGHEDLDRDDPEVEVKEQAVFAISQRNKHKSIPVLMDIARSHSDPRIRSRAIFWLGQEPDPRAVDLFATILREE